MAPHKYRIRPGSQICMLGSPSYSLCGYFLMCFSQQGLISEVTFRWFFEASFLVKTEEDPTNDHHKDSPPVLLQGPKPTNMNERCFKYHWGQNYFIPFLLFGGIIFGNYCRNFTAWIPEIINCCNVMVAAVLPWKPRKCRLQLQLFSRCCVGISYCNATSFFTGFYLFRI